MAGSIYDKITQPLTDLPSRAAKKISNTIGPSESSSNVPVSTARGFLSGAVEGAGNVVSDMTSPLSIAMMGLGLPRGVKNLKSLMSAGESAIGPSIEAMTPKRSIYSNELWDPTNLNKKSLLQNQSAQIAKVTDPMKARELEAEMSYVNRLSGLPSHEMKPLPKEAISVGPTRSLLSLLGLK